jgi:hypothetical protein
LKKDTQQLKLQGWGAPLPPSPCVDFKSFFCFNLVQNSIGIRLNLDWEEVALIRDQPVEKAADFIGLVVNIGSALQLEIFSLKFILEITTKCTKDVKLCKINFWTDSIILSKVIKTICSEIFWINNVNCFWTTTTTWICFQAKIVWANNIEEKSKIKNDLKIIFLTDWLSLLIRCQTEIEFSFYLSFFS